MFAIVLIIQTGRSRRKRDVCMVNLESMDDKTTRNWRNHENMDFGF